MPSFSSPMLVVAVVLVCASAFPAPALAQGKSGVNSVDACTTPPQAKLEAAIGKKVKPLKLPSSTPATAGVSVCMWSTADGRRTLSVSTYSPTAVRNTQSKTIDAYFESLKTQNASFSGRPHVIPGVVKRAVSFPASRGAGDTILVLRGDCTVVINATGFSPEEIVGIAKATGQ